ncbi:Hypothetical predicted protein [Octopus vulgaris]|uniref:PiggyBac transposable element-derived protein domain-containing protein n=1 Tax=Octopus vulgaris TaxID=6645 RepID=A0AA36AJV2_OCTVU|nr:Hypothetical predicted protein [Octopus vulgaris]
MNEQYVSRDRQDVWHSNPLTQAAVRTSSWNTVHQECGPSHFAKRFCDSIEACFTIFMRRNLLEVIRKWTNVEGLARELLSKKTVSVGTIRKNRVELPNASTNGKEINNTIFGFRKDSMILSYCPKKNYVVIFMSTMHSQPSIDSKSAEKKLEVTTCYNKTKGGVDTLDKMVRTYTCKRMTRRWPMVIFYNMTDISTVNVFIVAKQIHLQSFKDKRSENLIQLGKELAGVNAKQEQDKQSSSSANISQPNKKRTQTSTSF